MLSVTLAVIHVQPPAQGPVLQGDPRIEYSITINTSQDENGSISSYFFQRNPPSTGGVYYWHQQRGIYARISVARPLSSLRHIEGETPILLYWPPPPAPPRVFQGDSDDIYLLPSSHTGQTPPRQPFLERVMNARPVTPMRRPDPAQPASPDLDRGDSDMEQSDADEESELIGSPLPSYIFEEEDWEGSESFEGQEGPAASTANAPMTPGITFHICDTHMHCEIVLLRANKEQTFLQFLDAFCDTEYPDRFKKRFELRVVYIGESGVGDGPIIEMLSYLWKMLFEQTHHFVSHDGGHYIPSQHPETHDKMRYFGHLAAISLSYRCFPQGLHPMFFRRDNSARFWREDAQSFNQESCALVPESYKTLDENRQELADFWHTMYHFDTNVVPLERVISHDFFFEVVQPEMYRAIVLPNRMAQCQLDVFREAFFGYLDNGMSDANEGVLQAAIRDATFNRDITKERLLTFFRLSDGDNAQQDAFAHLLSILSEMDERTIRQLMYCVTNKNHPSTVSVRFDRTATHIFTCWSILQLRGNEENEIKEQLEVILAANVSDLPYTELDI